MLKLAERMRRIDASGIRKVFDLAKQLQDPINLSIGQPDFDVPDAVKNAACAAIQQGRNCYTPTQGIAELNQQVRDEEASYTGRAYAPEEVLITSGVSGGILLSLLALIDPGDEVLIPDPYFVMYKHLVRLLDGVPVYIDTYADDFVVDPERIAAAISDRTKVLLLNSPANPTGRILDRDCLAAIARICEGAGVLMVSDEIYRSFAYTDCPSVASMSEQVLVLGGHSKAFGMTGWRLGYAAGPKPVIQAMAMVQQYSFVCAPSVSQYAALACPDVDMNGHLADYRRKRDLMVSALSKNFEVAPADGAFYLWVRAPEGQTGTSFCERAIVDNVLVIPGNVFSERDSHFRVCYTVADERLQAGADILGRLA
jgi:aspartate/methionine/tyrosine aminotransferase